VLSYLKQFIEICKRRIGREDMQLVECVPNFSEGRSEKVINAIAEAISSTTSVSLLDVDKGYSTNRTVITFAGPPQAAVDAAFAAIRRACELIDMSGHHGEHPRMGACDVCPFVPISGISMEECAQLARILGKRVGDELGIPVYLYAHAASSSDRFSLADIRQGEYEALPEKMKLSSFVPDFGPASFNARSGATVIGARPFLIAYNVNLNTKSKKLANEIALNVREAGRVKRDALGLAVKDEKGKAVKEAGRLKEVRAVGWYVDEFNRAQVSMNLTNYQVTSMETAFDEVVAQADKLGLRVTGSEIVGLVPLAPVLQAGRYYLAKQGRSQAVSEKELVEACVQSLGLSDLSHFDPQEKIVEYKIKNKGKLLADLSLQAFADELACESAAPGGGSTASLAGALSAALSAMVANLSFEKKGFEGERDRFNEVGLKAQALKDRLVFYVDEDMRAFNSILEARRLPKGSDNEKVLRACALEKANKKATLTPLVVLAMTPALLELAEQMVRYGNPNSLSDAGVAALMAESCAKGAFYNVMINLKGLKEEISGTQDASSELLDFIEHTDKEARVLMNEVSLKAQEIEKLVLAQVACSLIEA
jgi:glutamate formiminotransferase/formiminotetrahydrofolate cyclodeaminase